MTDNGLIQAASLIFMGLLLNGCLSATNTTRINEYDIVDEAEIAKGIAKAGCLMSGGTKYEYGVCYREASQ